MQLEGKHIILTGAASGIGRATRELLAVHRVCVLAVDRDVAGLQNAIAAIYAGQPRPPAQVTPYICDLGHPDAIDALFAHAVRELGVIDLYIANAGFAYYEKIEAPDWGHIERLFQVNVFGTLYAAEKMRRLNAGRPYQVVVTASAMGFLGIPGYALYSASKAALHRFAQAYRYELDNPKSLVLVYPIATRTHFFESAARRVAPTPWPSQDARQVARTIVRGIQAGRTSIFPSIFFRLFLWLPFLWRLELWIEARRLHRWLEGAKG